MVTDPRSEIVPPLLINFGKLRSERIREYFEVFKKHVPSFVASLATKVDCWAPTFTRESLPILHDWLIKHVGTRPLSAVEKASLKSLTPLIEPPEATLSDETHWLVLEAGTYFGETLRQSAAGREWGLVVDNKRFIDYGYPLIIGPKIPANPFRLVANVMYSKIAGRPVRRLEELFDYWATLK